MPVNQRMPIVCWQVKPFKLILFEILIISRVFIPVARAMQYVTVSIWPLHHRSPHSPSLFFHQELYQAVTASPVFLLHVARSPFSANLHFLRVVLFTLTTATVSWMRAPIIRVADRTPKEALGQHFVSMCCPPTDCRNMLRDCQVHSLKSSYPAFIS